MMPSSSSSSNAAADQFCESAGACACDVCGGHVDCCEHDVEECVGDSMWYRRMVEENRRRQDMIRNSYLPTTVNDPSSSSLSSASRCGCQPGCVHNNCAHCHGVADEIYLCASRQRVLMAVDQILFDTYIFYCQLPPAGK
jgi:hypothetical protein